MSRFPLPIENYMSSVVVTIDQEQPLSEGIRLMRLHEIRHLPVLTHGRVTGLLSQRDVYLASSIDDRTDPASILVKEVMIADPYVVDPEEPVDSVASEMVRRRIGSAIVAHDGKLHGLFTSTDGLLALAAFVEDDRVPEVAEAETGGETP